jgi:hypothetical protein
MSEFSRSPAKSRRTGVKPEREYTGTETRPINPRCSSKHDSEIVSIDDGIQIERSDEPRANADWPRIEIRKPRSNVQSESVSQPRKRESQTVSIDEGTEID